MFSAQPGRARSSQIDLGLVGLSLFVLLAVSCQGRVADPATGACSGAERRCADNAVEECKQSYWVLVGECAGGTCQEGECVDVCTPQCGTRACGPDGCDGQCGACPDAEVCDADGECAQAPRSCGDGVCDADEDCATCPGDCGLCCGNDSCDATFGENCVTCALDCQCGLDEVCNEDRNACMAVCVPECDGRQCGSDGCDGACGTCTEPMRCSTDGRCVDPPETCGDGVCTPSDDEDCATCPADCGACCGDGECSSAVHENCGTCAADCACGADEQCNLDSLVCECRPVCDGQACADGCGGVCELCQPVFDDASYLIAVPVEQSTTDVQMVDIDGDGDLDIVWVSQPGEDGSGLEGVVEVSRNLGDGTFDTVEITSGETPAWTFVIPADIDNDFDFDLILTRLAQNSRTVAVMVNSGAGDFVLDESAVPELTGATDGLIYGRAAVMDIDGDDYDDLFLPVSFNIDLNADLPSVILLNNGDGTFRRADAAMLPSFGVGTDYTLCAVFGDVTGDGRPELYLGEAENQQRLMVLNDDRTAFVDESLDDGSGMPRLPTQTMRGYGCEMADLDMDGDTDIVVINDVSGGEGNWVTTPSYLFNNDGSGHFTITELPTLSGPHDPRALEFGDLNNDGRFDIIIGNNNGTVSHGGAALEILMATEDGFAPEEGYPDFGGVFGVSAGDINGDGFDDLAIATGYETVGGSMANGLLLSR